jgi:hypothetical protein
MKQTFTCVTHLIVLGGVLSRVDCFALLDVCGLALRSVDRLVDGVALRVVVPRPLVECALRQRQEGT